MATQTFPLALNRFLAKVVGSANDRELKRLGFVVDRVNGLEEATERLSDDELRATAEEFRGRLRDLAGAEPASLDRDEAKRAAPLDEALDDLLPEVFARVREAARR